MFGNKNTFCNLAGRVAVVTGAKQGMGRSHAIKLARAGAKVVLADLSQEECQKVVEEIKKTGGKAIAVKCNVSVKAEVDAMIQSAVQTFGKLDILVNNAGICPFKPFLEMTEEEFKQVIDVNLKGYFLCAQAAAKEMAKQQKGSIINIASIAMGQVGIGFAGISHYCASKGGIVAMTEAIALELAPMGIRVNVISPGAIDTPMAASVKQDSKTLEASLAKIPLKRMGSADEIANAVVFLASDESSYMTGSAVVIDGGWLAG